ncbi:MAG TPA: hypothetical protein VLH86_01735 [Patescibacteria group bacterium]|nr:hypothetical protein [Patescibacteria group bacterium]
MGEFINQTGEQSYQTERLLTEADHLNNYRRPDGSHDPYAIGELDVNLATAVQEATDPYAVTPTYREARDGTYIWMGQDPVQTALSGKRWYQSEQALVRMDIEVDEATDLLENLRPGFFKVFVSPRMTDEDAPLEVAKQEHLADDDAIRITGLDAEGDVIKGMKLESLLVRDIPLSAWIAMANDPYGLFAGRVSIPGANSALPVMRAHRDMYVPAELLPEGPISVLAAAVPYIADAVTRAKVERHLASFREADQADSLRRAQNIARRWREFEVELADSLYYQEATPGVRAFIKGIAENINEDTRSLIAERLMPDGNLAMDRELAAALEAARRNTLWVAAAVVAGNEDVLAQLSPEVAQRIHDNEMIMQTALDNGYTMQQLAELEAEHNSLIAEQNVRVGRGCPGESADIFERKAAEGSEDGRNDEASVNDAMIRCIKCRQYVPKRKVVKKTCWECPKCTHKVDICTGETLNEGGDLAERLLRPLAVDGLAERIAAEKQARADASHEPAGDTEKTAKEALVA